jgi:RAD51-like protein 1
MANRPLTRLGVEETVIRALQASLGVTTAADLLNCSPLELMVCADMSLREAEALTNNISTRIAPRPVSANQFFQKRLTEKRFLSTGFRELDRAMRGGILLNSVTDICGTPGVGKTQFCVNVVAYTAAVEDASVIYIDAELKLDPNRILEIALHAMPERYDPTMNQAAPHHTDDLLNRIKVRHLLAA